MRNIPKAIGSVPWKWCGRQLDKSQKEMLIGHPERVNVLPSLCLEGTSYVPHPEITLEMCLLDRQKGSGEHGETGKAAIFSDGD